MGRSRNRAGQEWRLGGAEAETLRCGAEAVV